METLTLSDFGSIASIISLMIGLFFGFFICKIKKITNEGNNNTINTDIQAHDFVGRDKK